MSESVTKEWFLNVPWGKLAMLSWGEPSLAPVLLIHGFLDTAASFFPLVAALPPRYHYVAFDLPGHGHSDTMPGPPISPIHLVEAVRQVVDQLRWDTFYCITHSMGYLTGIYYNAAFPGRIRSLVALAGAISIQAHGLVESPTKWFEFSIDSYYSYRAFTWDIKAKKIHIPPITEDMLYSILSIPTPTLCLVPTEDRTPILFVQYHVDMLERVISDKFKLVDVPGGHSVHMTSPELIVPHIVRFLDEGIARSKL